MVLVKLNELKIGMTLKRKKTRELVTLQDIIEDTNENKLYSFSGFVVNKKVMPKMFETDLGGSFKVYNN